MLLMPGRARRPVTVSDMASHAKTHLTRTALVPAEARLAAFAQVAPPVPMLGWALLWANSRPLGDIGDVLRSLTAALGDASPYGTATPSRLLEKVAVPAELALGVARAASRTVEWASGRYPLNLPTPELVAAAHR